ncbi:hypothetical protein [Streptomyces sp. NPDC048603]|uniref:hypothetical protein n=1 Tax=Streptomyces sp. NPDC048603 TaxID=3365577 RepID=UPI00371FB535
MAGRVTDAAFDLSDIRGAVLDAGPGETAISLGAGGRLCAAAGEYRLDDRSWHLSAAGIAERVLLQLAEQGRVEAEAAVAVAPVTAQVAGPLDRAAGRFPAVGVRR